MRKISEMEKLRDKLFFTAEDVAEAFKIKAESAWVTCSRYVKNGIFVRLKYNFYVVAEGWRNISQENLFRIANYLQVPSYISFMSALSYYEVTTQIQRSFVENAGQRRSVKFKAGGAEFDFYKMNKLCYFGFERKDDMFIASKEKAFVDAVYLYSFGKYKFDAASLDISKLNTNKIKQILKVFPRKTAITARKICKTL